MVLKAPRGLDFNTLLLLYPLIADENSSVKHKGPSCQ